MLYQEFVIAILIFPKNLIITYKTEFKNINFANSLQYEDIHSDLVKI